MRIETDVPSIKLLAMPWKRRSEAERCAVFWKSFKNLMKFKLKLNPMTKRAEYAHLCQSSSVMSWEINGCWSPGAVTGGIKAKPSCNLSDTARTLIGWNLM